MLGANGDYTCIILIFILNFFLLNNLKVMFLFVYGTIFVRYHLLIQII
jgi:hypothetical protein